MQPATGQAGFHCQKKALRCFKSARQKKRFMIQAKIFSRHRLFSSPFGEKVTMD